MLADANLENASPELVPAEEVATERTGLPLLLPATGSRAGAPETHLGQQSYPQAVNFANMSMHDGRNLSMAANFFSQTNVFHVHDENRARLRTELSFLEIEAERRHTLAMEEQARANEQGVSNLEELAERVHATRMASCEERFARFEQRSATRELGLIEELDEMQARFTSIEQNVSQSEALLAQRMQEQYHQQLNSFAAQQSQFLLSEFEENFQVYQRTEREEFDAMLDAAKEQQDEIEDKLLATERALRFAEESQQQQAPVFPSAPSAPNVVTPNMLSSSMRGLLAQMNPGNTTAQQPQAGATAAPSEGQTIGGPVSANAAGSAQPAGTTAGPLTTPPGLGNPAAPVTGMPATGLTSETLLATQAAILENLRLMKGERTEDDKPKVKEAESIRLPDFPNPETYRSWKTATREAIRAASDRPDDAFEWILEVYDKNASHEKLREPGKFVTLDTKLLAALSKVAKGDLGRHILNFKETEAAQKRSVRGRQVLYLFEQHFKTNEEVGSLYSVEDLLKVNMVGDDLTSFLHNWESVIAGMSHVPEEMVLRDILLRQIRKSSRMKYDLEIYDRAKEGSTSHTYSFLLQSIRDLLTRERVRKNRDRIAKSHGDKFGAPAPTRPSRPSSRGGRERGRSPSRSTSRSRSSNASSPKRSNSPKGVCYDFLKGTCTRGDKCSFLHKTRSQSPNSKKPDKAPKIGGRIQRVCTFWKKGKCNKGENCRFLHQEKPAAAAKAKAAAATPDPTNPKPRSPSPAPRRPKSRGRSKSRDKAAACCLAAPAVQPSPLEDTWEVDFKGGVLIRHHRVERTGWFAPGSDCPINVRRLKSKVRVEKTFPEYPRFAAVAWNWRKTAPEPSSRAWVGKSTFKIEPLKVTFCDEPVMKAIPVEGDGFRHIRRKRRFSVAYATAEDCPKPSMKEQNRARIEAKQLEALVISMTNDVPTKCGYMCEDLTCESCERTPAPACSGIVPGLEFLADTGSEEDLISKEDLRIHYPSVEVKTASRPVSLITANGPVLGDQSVKVDIPELSLPVECYLLESTPPVCSVGRRCMDEGYDFHWHAGKVPFFVTPDGRKLKCKLKGRVPVIAEGSVATPAIEEESNIVSPVFSQGGSSLFQ